MRSPARSWLAVALLAALVSCRPVHGSSTIIVGRDGWYFYGGDGALEDHSGRTTAAAYQAMGWGPTLEARRAFLDARGVRYLFVVVPDKETVYAEHLPEGMLPPDARTRLDHFVRDMTGRNVELLDLRAPFAALKPAEDLYYRHDTHWNDLGMFHAHRILLERLGRWFPEVRALDVSTFVRETVPKDSDLSEMRQHVFTMEVTQLRPKGPFAARPAALRLDASQGWTDGWPDEWRLPRAFECPGKPLTVLFLRDSFFDHAMMPMLAECFGRSVFVTCHPGLARLEHLVEREKPDLVVEQLVERLLFYGMPR